MRKYKQLLLVVITIASLALLLIYRHEYNRLRYVLEVFNFFGDPKQCSFLSVINSSANTEQDWGPVPVWLTLNDETYVYSAFLKSQDDVESVVVDNNKRNSIKYCYLWYERKLNAVTGKLKYSIIDQLDHTNELALYKYYCTSNFATKAPYAVSFNTKKKRFKDLKKIFLQTLNSPQVHLNTICVLPSDSYSKTNVIEFISYHHIVGFNSFIIYNNNIPYYQMKLVKKYSSKLGIHMVDYPWNYPGPSSTGIRKIIKEDCLLRTRDMSDHVTVLNWTEFIVPRTHDTVDSMMEQMDPANRTHQFNLKVLEFCIINRDVQEPAMLHNFDYDESKLEEFLNIYRNNLPKNNVINAHQITTSTAAIHRYIQCASQPLHITQQNVSLKFTSQFRKSVLFDLFRNGKL